MFNLHHNLQLNLPYFIKGILNQSNRSLYLCVSDSVACQVVEAALPLAVVETAILIFTTGNESELLPGLQKRVGKV